MVLRLICYLVLATGFVSAQEFNFEIEKGKVFTDDKSKTWVLFNADELKSVMRIARARYYKNKVVPSLNTKLFDPFSSRQYRLF